MFLSGFCGLLDSNAHVQSWESNMKLQRGKKLSYLGVGRTNNVPISHLNVWRPRVFFDYWPLGWHCWEKWKLVQCLTFHIVTHLIAYWYHSFLAADFTGTLCFHGPITRFLVLWPWKLHKDFFFLYCIVYMHVKASI